MVDRTGDPSAVVDPPVPSVLLQATVAAAVEFASGQGLPARVACLVRRLTKAELAPREGRQRWRRRLVQWPSPPRRHRAW